MKPIKVVLLFLLLPFVAIHAQNIDATDINSSFDSKQIKTFFNNYPARSIGPVVMSGRVSDFAVTKNSKKFFVSFASGGVFVTDNYGDSFTPIFDGQDALGIGDIALSKANENILWVGTGEKNSSRSSYSGSGIYKTSDAGKTWQYLGLRNSHHISRIVTHPTDTSIAWVGSIGPLYSYGGERGLYKTSDGGKTWNRTLFVNDSTGVIDVVIHPNNPNILWAATWQRIRYAWDFIGNGSGSAIYKSTDGGETWNKIESGLPTGPYVGRIGLSVSQSNPDIIYALIDNQETEKEERKKNNDTYYFDDFNKLKVSDLEKNEKKLESFLRNNGFPAKYSSKSVIQDLQENKYTLKDIANYSGDANAALFSTSVKGAEVYKSTNGGNDWSKVNSYNLDGVYFTYGYYFGEIRVTPSNPDEVYILGVPMLRTRDGGKNWSRVDKGNVHVDHQALWIDPNDANHILLGNDGGIYSSFDAGEHFRHHNTLSVGQFYTVMVDNEKPYNVYGGLQDNGVFVGSSKSVPNRTPNWERLMGGDGMHIAVHPENSAVVYTGFQFGNYYRIDRKSGKRKYITPKHDIGSDKYRFNWNTPVVLSKHNPEIVYMGAQKLLRSVNAGDSFTEISPDLTTNYQPQGNVPYSTITQIDESPFQFGLIWIGTDDGHVQVTVDGGANWTNVSKGLPEGLWVSKIKASPHDKNEVYIALTGYRFDHFNSYLFRSKDMGQTWEQLDNNLPEQATNTIIPDTKIKGLLYAGTDHGGFMSLDDGKTWNLLPGNIPNVAVYDLIIQDRESELVVSTHGRSMYIVDLKPIHEYMKYGQEKKMYLQKIKPITFSSRWGSKRNFYSDEYLPKQTFSIFSNESGKAALSIKKGKKTIKEWKLDLINGYQEINWDLKLKSKKKDSPTFLEVGEYSVILKKGKSTSTQTFEVKERR